MDLSDQCKHIFLTPFITEKPRPGTWLGNAMTSIFATAEYGVLTVGPAGNHRFRLRHSHVLHSRNSSPPSNRPRSSKVLQPRRNRSGYPPLQS